MTIGSTQSLGAVRESPAAILARTQSDDPNEARRAWNALYKHLAEQVFKPVLNGLLPSLRDEHEELIQECFVEKLIPALMRWRDDGAPRSLERFALTVLRNFVRDRKTKGCQAQFEASHEQAAPDLIELHPQPDESEPAELTEISRAEALETERLQWMRAEFDRLTHPEQRQVIHLLMGGLSPAEVARQVQLSAEAVRRAKQKVLERLRRAARRRPDLFDT